MGGVLLQHLFPLRPTHNTIRGGLRSPSAPAAALYAGTARTEAVDGLLRSHDEVLAEVRQRLLQAQELSKKYYDAAHRDLELQVGVGCGYVSSTAPLSP